MKVFDALRAKKGDPSGKDLADRLVKEVRVRALAKLGHTKDLFPYFTDHTIKHGDGIVEILDWLMPDGLKDKLNEWELYFLIAAAYLHDIGMVEGCPGTPSGPEWDGFLDDFRKGQEEQGISDNSAVLLAAKREFVRDRHHIRSEEYITRAWKELGLRAIDIAGEGRIVARLALGHRNADLGDSTLFGPVPFGNNQLIRRDLLAAYLRLADELDTTAKRTPWAEYEVLTSYDEESAVEWAKHLSLTGVSHEDGTIVLGGTCYDHAIYLRLRKLHRDIEDKLQELKRMLGRPYATGDGFQIDDPLPYHDIELRIEHEGYLPINIKFELQDREITQLIMGERLYGDKTAAIRELLQNTVDTCREASSQRPPSWKAKIVVAEEEDGKVLSVTDNGMGMNEHIVRQYFSRIGISYYGSHEFQGRFKPISEFGIGILSCFMMAELIEVDSKREGFEPIHLEIRSLTEPFVPRRGSRPGPGTDIRLHLKPDAIGSFDLLERVRYFAKHVEFPVLVQRKDGDCQEVVDDGYSPTVDDIVGPALAGIYSGSWTPKRIAKVSTTRRSGGIELGVTLLDSFRVPRTTIEKGVVFRGGSRVCQQGFFVGPFHETFSKIASDTWCELNLSGDATLPLTADRTRSGESSEGVWQRVSNLYAQAVEALFRTTIEDPGPSQWWRYHLRHYRDAITPVPQALKRATKQHALFCTVTRGGFRPAHLDAIRNWNGPIFLVALEDHRELERVRKALARNAIVVVLPQMWHGREEYWYMSLIKGDAVLHTHWALLNHLGIKFRRADIDGRRRIFIDSGSPLEKWRIQWNWVRPAGWAPETVFDLNHPFSGILLSNCQRRLPRRSSLLVAELFRQAHNFSSGEIARRQREALEVFHEEAVIPALYSLPQGSESSPKAHDCPYKGLTGVSSY